jgi:citrate lyase subunit beta/citryl-CoA lyase
MSTIRSILFVPGDSERKLAKAEDFTADALVLDLEDSVSPQNKPVARERVRAFLDAHAEGRKWQLWVRINPLNLAESLDDLAAVVGGRPDGIMLPKPDGPEDAVRLGFYLDVLEARDGVPAGHVKILPVATETAKAPFSLGDYAKVAPPRLIGLTWGAEDLSSAIGAATNKDETGAWDEPYRMVRSLCLLAAHAANVQAIDTLYGDYRDESGLRRSCAIARRQGFTGRIAIHPDQVQAINESFSPSPDEVAHARRVIAAFDAQPGAGTVGLDGLMLDIPHLRLARRILATHESHQNG